MHSNKLEDPAFNAVYALRTTSGYYSWMGKRTVAAYLHVKGMAYKSATLDRV